MPRSRETEPVIRLSQLSTLHSDGGTSPSCLNTRVEAKTILGKCSAWFLLTDGAIENHKVRDFSHGICESGLHGTPCVIVLFGCKSSRPSICNVSDGLSIFSNAADCLFLFHDVDSTQVYILQSKGKFNAILPPGCNQLVLDLKTLWKDLPTFGCHQLFDLPFPTRQQLRPDDLLLQSGQKINLHDVYQDRVDGTIARDIMENNDNLKSVLLATQLRGKDDNISRWISKQKLKGPNVLSSDRPDADYKATKLTHDVLHTMFQEHPDFARCQLGTLFIRSRRSQ